MSYKKIARLVLAILVIGSFVLTACAPKATPTPAPLPTVDPFQKAPQDYAFFKGTEGETQTMYQIQFVKNSEVEATRSLGSQDICTLTVLDIDPDQTQLPEEQRFVLMKQPDGSWEGIFYEGANAILKVQLLFKDDTTGYNPYICERQE